MSRPRYEICVHCDHSRDEHSVRGVGFRECQSFNCSCIQFIEGTPTRPCTMCGHDIKNHSLRQNPNGPYPKGTQCFVCSCREFDKTTEATQMTMGDQTTLMLLEQSLADLEEKSKKSKLNVTDV